MGILGKELLEPQLRRLDRLAMVTKEGNQQGLHGLAALLFLRTYEGHLGPVQCPVLQPIKPALLPQQGTQPIMAHGALVSLDGWSQPYTFRTRHPLEGAGKLAEVVQPQQENKEATQRLGRHAEACCQQLGKRPFRSQQWQPTARTTQPVVGRRWQAVTPPGGFSLS